MSARPLFGTLCGLLATFGWWWSSEGTEATEVLAVATGAANGPAPAPDAESLVVDPSTEAAQRETLEAPAARTAAAEPVDLEIRPPREQPLSAVEQLASWLDDLRNDNVKGNATDAAARLTSAIWKQSYRDMLRPLAEPLLYSDDRQQRLLVTTLLLRLENHSRRAGDGRIPHPLLEQRALEWLARPEQLGFNCNGLTPRAFYARTFCVNQGHAMHDRLAGKLRSDDEEVSFYAALLLGVQGVTQHAPSIARILVPHLADNKIEEDALEAAYAMKRLGAAVLPWLPTEPVDEQQEYLLEALRAEIGTPGSSASSEGRWDISQSAPHGPVSHYRPKAYELYRR